MLKIGMKGYTKGPNEGSIVMSFYFQLSLFQFSLFVFSVSATAVSLYVFSRFKVRVLYVHFMYMSVLFDSCNLVFCFILTTRLYA